VNDRHTCFESIDRALAEKGVRLSMAIQFSPTTGETVSTPRVMIEPIDDTTPKGRKAAKNKNMLASNCPFCGVVLPRLGYDVPTTSARAAVTAQLGDGGES
jgi:hypothetical protein